MIRLIRRRRAAAWGAARVPSSRAVALLIEGRAALKLAVAADENLRSIGCCRLEIFSSTSRLPLGPWVQACLRAGLLCALWALLTFKADAWNADLFVRAAERLGPRTAGEARALVRLMSDNRGANEEAKLTVINQFFNQRIRFREDTQVWGQIDYWASPLEMLDRGEGDCEDYAIAKYFTLIAAGVPSPKLRLVYVRAQLGGPGGLVQAHMVLAYYGHPDMQPLILDNLINEIRPASRRPDLAPVFSFNAEGLWQGVGQATAGDPLARLSRWRDALNKARLEGIW